MLMLKNSEQTLEPHKTIAVFAASSVSKEKEKYYFDLAYETGKLLAQAGFVVASGAGPGLMDELMHGASEAGGQTIGIGLDLPGRFQSKYTASLSLFAKLSPRQDQL